MSKHRLVESLESRQLLSTVAVDLSSTSQTIRALGANFARIARTTAVPVSDSVMQYELSHLHPTQARVPINLMAWEPSPDNSDPNKINWSGFKDSGRQHEQFLQIKDFHSRGMSVIASVFDGPNWMVTDPQDLQKRTVDPNKYAFLAESIGAWLIRVRDTYGVKIDRISFNEQNAGYNLRMSQDPFTAFMHVAGPQLAKMGLGYVKWLVGDD